MTDATFQPYGAAETAPPPAKPVAGRVRIEGEVKQALETGRNRLIVTGALFALAFTAISIRLFDVTLIGRSAEPRVATAPRGGALETFRADITDRNGVLLATSLETASLYANPRKVLDAADAARRLAGVLGDSEDDLAAKLGSGKSFVWIRRNLTPSQQYEVNRLGIPGLDFQRDERRVYPLGNIAAHIVGFTDIDNKGLAGIERQFDEQLRGAQHPVKLALDVRVQHVLREELERAVEEYKAVGAAGMVVDARTGEIISMVSLPDFDPHRPGAVEADARFNRPTLGAYEMGSTFKLFTLALGLDSGVATLNSSWDARAPIHISRFTIKDYRGGERRYLSTSEVLQYSSNIGAARMGVAIGPARQKDFMKRIGMLDSPRIEMPEVSKPMYPSNWKEINTMTISFGHGLAVSPLQLVNGVATLVNGGVLRPATLLKRDPNDVPPGTQVIKPETSRIMRGLMRMVVEKGTGKKANIPGYRVGGKTGSAEKVSAQGGYARKSLLSSFVGAFPIEDPRYVVLAMLDEPHGTRQTGGFATGGAVAAPTIGKIVARIGPLLAIEPVDLPPRPAAPSVLNARVQGKSVAAN
jgi:cell division protein FtsI (penicillin-binding protein 3)